MSLSGALDSYMWWLRGGRLKLTPDFCDKAPGGTMPPFTERKEEEQV